MNAKVHRLVLGMMLVSGAWGCAQPARGDQASWSSVLIYCDKSPGTIADAVALESLIEGNNGSFTYATNPTQLESRLAQGGWSDVFVLAKHATTEPAYATALRNYATANSNKAITLLTWKEHTSPPTSDHAVLATTAVSVWLIGNTTTTYALSDNAPGDPSTTSGLVFADFQGIQTRSYIDLGEFSEETEGGVTQALIIQWTTCQQECNLTYQQDVAACGTTFASRQTTILALYGPQGPTNPGNPQQLQTLMNQAAQLYTSCLQGAFLDYSLCLAQC